MKILLIGGTRFIGPHVVRFLREGGHEVAVFHRGKSALQRTEGVKEYIGDRKDLGRYEKEFGEFSPDVVIDMICLNESSARTLAEVVAPFTKRLVMISSCDVYRAYGIIIGKEAGEAAVPLTEESQLRETRYPYRRELDDGSHLGDYDKIPAEEVVMGHPKIEGTVLRLPMVHGPGDYQHRLLPYVKRADDKRSHIILEKAQSKWRTTRGYVENVAWAIALAATDERAAGRIYNVADDIEYTEQEWAKLITEACGAECQIITANNEELPDELKVDCNFSQDLLTSSRLIRSELGFEERVPFSEALKRTIAWEREVKTPIDYEPENIFLAKSL